MSERFETMRSINGATVYKYSPFLYYLLSSVLYLLTSLRIGSFSFQAGGCKRRLNLALVIMHLSPDNVGEGIIFQAVRLPCPSVRLSRQILLPQYLMNSLSNLNGTYREYSLAPTDDLIRFWRSMVKVTAGCRVFLGVVSSQTRSSKLQIALATAQLWFSLRAMFMM